ncbi:MAG: hypothetical protein E7554_05405 [Ruminococcaceae bacterium]|nr:hypothetical protein [Oscillospiraceae bacterium]
MQKIRDFIKSIRPKGGWLYNKKLLMALSLLASIACWVFLTLYVNADSEKTVTDVPIKIDTTALEDFGLEMIAITGPEVFVDGKLDVNVVGSAYQISQVTAEEITVLAQNSSVNKAGEYTLSLVLSCSNKNVNVSLKDSHKTVSVWFDSIMEKNFMLDKPVVTGVSVPADSGYIIGDPSGFVKSVSVSGPESVIEKIASVQLRAELNEELSATTTVEGAICYLDENGELLDPEQTRYITILDYNDIGVTDGVAAGAPAPTDCTISVPIRMECELKIVPVFKNVPEGFDVSTLKYTLSQDTIRLEGDIDVMKKYSEDGVFSLDGIDLSTLTPSNRRFTIKLTFSSAVTSLNGESEILVTFDMSGYKQDTLTVGSDRIVLTNADGHNVTVASDSIEVAVVGRSSTIDRLDEDDITVIVNMTDDEWTSGVREKSAQVYVSNGNRAWAVGTYTVKIKVE